MSMRGAPLLMLVAKRFLVSKSSDSFLSFIALVSVLGVALGVTALTVVTSVLNGFESELTRVITGMNGEVILYSRGEPIGDAKIVEAKVLKVLPEVQSITHSFVAQLMVSGSSGVAGAILEGVNPVTVGEVTALPNRIFRGRLPNSNNEIALGTVLADRIGANVGDTVKLIIPFFDESPAGSDSIADVVGAGGVTEEGEKFLTEKKLDLPGFKGRTSSRSRTDEVSSLPRTQDLEVVGLIRMGMYEYDSKFMFTTLSATQTLLDQPGKITTLKMKLKPGSQSRKCSLRLTDNFGYPFRAKDWSLMNKNLFQAIALQKTVIGIILTVIIIVAGFNVVSTLMMMIHDKTKEISILKVLGLRPVQGFQLFSILGLGMGVTGTAAGLLFGLGLCEILKKFQFVDLPADVYYINFLPVLVSQRDLLLITGVSLLVSFLATLYPGWKVATRSPLDGLRYE